MLKRLGWIFSICILTCGCTNSILQDHTAKFLPDGQSKATVAIFPVFDKSNSEIGWDLSEEFTSYIHQNIQKKSSFYLNSSEELNHITTSLNAENNPFSDDYDWIKETFKEYEYVVFTEIIEHDIHAKTVKGNFFDKLTPSSELSLTMRIRIFNLKDSQPEVILQELIHQNHLIPKPSNIQKPNPEKWKRMSFHISPIGLSHSQFTREVCNRIEDYILISKNK